MTTEASRFAGGLFDPLQASLPDVVTGRHIGAVEHISATVREIALTDRRTE